MCRDGVEQLPGWSQPHRVHVEERDVGLPAGQILQDIKLEQRASPGWQHSGWATAPRQHPDVHGEISEQVVECNPVNDRQARRVGVDGELHVWVQPSAGRQRDSQGPPVNVLELSIARMPQVCE